MKMWYFCDTGFISLNMMIYLFPIYFPEKFKKIIFSMTEKF